MIFIKTHIHRMTEATMWNHIQPDSFNSLDSEVLIFYLLKRSKTNAE